MQYSKRGGSGENHKICEREKRETAERKIFLRRRGNDGQKVYL